MAISAPKLKAEGGKQSSQTGRRLRSDDSGQLRAVPGGPARTERTGTPLWRGRSRREPSQDRRAKPQHTLRLRCAC